MDGNNTNPKSSPAMAKNIPEPRRTAGTLDILCA